MQDSPQINKVTIFLILPQNFKKDGKKMKKIFTMKKIE